MFECVTSIITCICKENNLLLKAKDFMPNVYDRRKIFSGFGSDRYTKEYIENPDFSPAIIRDFLRRFKNHGNMSCVPTQRRNSS